MTMFPNNNPTSATLTKWMDNGCSAGAIRNQHKALRRHFIEKNEELMREVEGYRRSCLPDLEVEGKEGEGKRKRGKKVKVGGNGVE